MLFLVWIIPNVHNYICNLARIQTWDICSPERNPMFHSLVEDKITNGRSEKIDMQSQQSASTNFCGFYTSLRTVAIILSHVSFMALSGRATLRMSFLRERYLWLVRMDIMHIIKWTSPCGRTNLYQMHSRDYCAGYVKHMKPSEPVQEFDNRLKLSELKALFVYFATTQGHPTQSY